MLCSSLFQLFLKRPLPFSHLGHMGQFLLHHHYLLQFIFIFMVKATQQQVELQVYCFWGVLLCQVSPRSCWVVGQPVAFRVTILVCECCFQCASHFDLLGPLAFALHRNLLRLVQLAHQEPQYPSIHLVGSDRHSSHPRLLCWFLALPFQVPPILQLIKLCRLDLRGQEEAELPGLRALALWLWLFLSYFLS